MEYACLLPSVKVDRILIVDDAPDNVFLIQTILEEEGYDIITAANGQLALELVHNQRPDLVLLDVIMPEMNGYQVTQAIRQDPALPYIPILLITAHDRPKVAEALDLGADDFIRKPVGYDELLARVRSLLRLKHSVDERDQIARQRENFVSCLAHDLRTPLLASSRMLVLLQEGALGSLPPEAADALGIMYRSNQNLLVMVNNLLEIYRHASGKKMLHLMPANIPTLIQEVVAELLPLAEQKGLELHLNLPNSGPNSLPLQVMADNTELRRVLVNLLDNAIKFTDTGYVKVGVEVLDGEKDAALASTIGSSPGLRIAIQDSGPGISPADRINLFDRFAQGQHRRGGSGLGLHLSHQIISLHGGELRFEPAPEGGSIFAIVLPATRTTTLKISQGVVG
jgi:two-component system, sensor histidine kinase and response regulator